MRGKKRENASSPLPKYSNVIWIPFPGIYLADFNISGGNFEFGQQPVPLNLKTKLKMANSWLLGTSLLEDKASQKLGSGGTATSHGKEYWE